MPTIPSVRQQVVLAVLTFLLFLILGFGADILVLRRPQYMIADDLILATLAALLVYRYERARSRALGEKLSVIRDMNAFVRNELQILYACLENPQKDRVPTIERSVERIDWALRELLPGSHHVGTTTKP